MTRGNWVGVLLALGMLLGGWYAYEAGYLAQGRTAYAEWAEGRRIAADGRAGRGEKPTLTDQALDALARSVTGR